MEQAELGFEVQEHRETQREALVFKVLRHTLGAISERGLRYLSLMAVIGLFAYAAWEPDTSRIVVGCCMAVVYVITLFKKGDSDAGN